MAGILTLGGNAAAVKLWRKSPEGWAARTLWQTAFGGAESRMRDGEIADLFGNGPYVLAVATRDQGVVAMVRRYLWANGRFDRETILKRDVPGDPVVVASGVRSRRERRERGRACPCERPARCRS